MTMELRMSVAAIECCKTSFKILGCVFFFSEIIFMPKSYTQYTSYKYRIKFRIDCDHRTIFISYLETNVRGNLLN